MSPVLDGLDAQRHGIGPDDSGEVSLAELTINPYPTYRRLRDHGVVWVESVNRWLVTRWDDIDMIERDGDRFTAQERDSLQTRVMGRTMLRSDGAQHRRLRAALQTPLSPRVIDEHWLPRFKQIANEMVDAIKPKGESNLIPEFINPFSARCLGLVLGLTDATDDELLFWSQALMDGTANYGDDPSVWERTDRAVREVKAATNAAIARVRETPDPSLISAMVHGGAGGPLTDDEVRSNTMLVIGGGLNEPRDGIGIGVWALLNHPDQLALTMSDPAAWFPRVTEETLRWMSPLAMFPREVAKPVAFGETKLEPGARLGLLVASANRDERHWERPDEFDITRPKARNVAFGVGHHFCLGVWMSRHEIGSAALPALFERLPGLRLDLDDPAVLTGWVFRGHTRLPVRWTTDTSDSQRPQSVA